MTSQPSSCFQEVGWNNVAFVLLNRFVDIVEMIDDGEFDSGLGPACISNVDNERPSNIETSENTQKN